MKLTVCDNAMTSTSKRTILMCTSTARRTVIYFLPAASVDLQIQIQSSEQKNSVVFVLQPVKNSDFIENDLSVFRKWKQLEGQQYRSWNSSQVLEPKTLCSNKFRISYFSKWEWLV